jgi:hypothetical protein
MVYNRQALTAVLLISAVSVFILTHESYQLSAGRTHARTQAMLGRIFGFGGDPPGSPARPRPLGTPASQQPQGNGGAPPPARCSLSPPLPGLRSLDAADSKKRSCPDPQRACRSSSSPRAYYSENALILGAVHGDGARGPGGGAGVAVVAPPVQLPPSTDSARPSSPPSRPPPTPLRVNYAGSSPALMGRSGDESHARSSTLMGQGESVEATAKPGASLRWCWRRH